MKSVLRKIGNSKGVIIPASFLIDAGLEDRVEISLQANAVVITPAPKELRCGWFEGYNSNKDETAWSGWVPLPSEQQDWHW